MPAQRSTDCSMILSAKELADALAVDRKTVTDVWVPAGCPVVHRADETRPDIGRPKAWAFNLADVYRWQMSMQRGGGAYDYNEERAREKAAKADMAEMARDKLRGRLIEIADVAAIVVDEYAKVRARLLSLPAALAMRVQHETDLQLLERLIKAAVSEALDELAADTRADWSAVAVESAEADGSEALAAATDEDAEEKAA